MDRRLVRVWDESQVLPGGRRKPDLFVGSLFVDDVGAVVTSDFHCQHTALYMNQGHNTNSSACFW